MSSPPQGPERVPITGDDDVVRVRQLVRAYAQRMKLSLVDQTKLVTAASELARNTLVYGGGGFALVDVNYGATLNLFDRAFGTFRLPEERTR